MLGSGTRDARRTERYLDGLMAADDRRAAGAPADADLDPDVRFAARELRAGLTRVHPSFRFEDALASRLSAGAARLRAGLPIEELAPAAPEGVVEPFRSLSARAAAAAGADADVAAATAAAVHSRAIWPAAALRRLPEMAARPSRPLIVGGVGVGVASAALSIGAVYVAWRYSHPASGRMGRAARAAHGHHGPSNQSRRSGVINGIRGVVS
jgi:hypothetical protein